MTQAEIFERNWNRLKAKVRPNWMSLNDREVEAIDGKADILVELLHEKYGITQAQAAGQIERFLEENGMTAVSGAE
jgi:hypothetical protein